MIHKLATVYPTINNSIGYWLRIAEDCDLNNRIAMLWDKNTAMI